MKIFTIFKCLIRFLNLLFTILKFFRQCYVGDVAKISAGRMVDNSRTEARARSAQGASQFAAGYAAARLYNHSDNRPSRYYDPYY